MSHVFGRSSTIRPRAVAARGSTIVDAAGKTYLDGSGGAVVTAVGHGRIEVADAIAAQLAAVGYVHGTVFDTGILDAYAAELAAIVPVPDARVYPVSGGSEAVETALKLARAYHLARGEDRFILIGRDGAYHGNTRGALDVSARASLRRPYLPWLGQAARVPAAYEYRCAFPDTHPNECGAAHARRLRATIENLGPERVAAFIAEPVAGATLGACVPPDDYWPRMAEVCREYGVLIIVDEVMTGFGRTGRWFASDHWGLEPDVVTAGKGAAAGYWPLGLAVCSGDVHETVAATGFAHGFTYSHHPAGAAAGAAVLSIMRREGLVDAARVNGARLGDALRAGLGEHARVGDVRGLGLLWAVEFVADRGERRPFPRGDRVAERVTAAALDMGLLVYPSTGGATGVDGDAVLLGPPLSTTPAELERIAELLGDAVVAVLGATRG